MWISLHERIVLRFPGAKIGILMCKNATVKKDDLRLEKKKKEVIQEAITKFKFTPLAQHPYIKSWRDMYRSFGTKPGDYRPSAEALVRRVLRNKGLPKINTAVDAYNIMSVKYMIPMGGFDLKKVEGDILIRFSSGRERFLAIGASHTEETYEGEVVYSDDNRILTRRWNHRDCDETKITDKTKDIILLADGTQDIPKEEIRKSIKDLASTLKNVCGGEVATQIMDDKQTRIKI